MEKYDMDDDLTVGTSEPFDTIIDEDAGTEDMFPTYGELTDREWPVHSFHFGGKDIEVVHEELGTFWKIQFRQGGKLPAELQGSFTSEQDAIQAVEIYMARKNPV